MKVYFVPPGASKPNNMIERRFITRCKMAKTLAQNTSLKNDVKKNKKIIIKAIRILCFLNDEHLQKGKNVLARKLFSGQKVEIEIKSKI